MHIQCVSFSGVQNVTLHSITIQGNEERNIYRVLMIILGLLLFQKLRGTKYITSPPTFATTVILKLSLKLDKYLFLCFLEL